ncbi:MAG: SxtJ family membrane protein [bacterium]|nr:SxtJ family membrane protein [bacterium]MDT8365289.1 SxtJ family membrane protein [bacterium]
MEGRTGLAGKPGTGLTMEVNDRPDNKELRNFGLTSAIIVVLLFGLGLPWLRGHGWPRWPWYLSGALGVAGLAAPAALGPVYRVWMKFGHIMGRVNSTIILTVVFFVVFTPVGLIMRILNRDILNRKFDKETDSYRVASQPSNTKKLERPF